MLLNVVCFFSLGVCGWIVSIHHHHRAQFYDIHESPSPYESHPVSHNTNSRTYWNVSECY